MYYVHNNTISRVPLNYTEDKVLDDMAARIREDMIYDVYTIDRSYEVCCILMLRGYVVCHRNINSLVERMCGCFDSRDIASL